MDKKSKIKAGLSFGITMTIFFIAEALLTHNLTSERIIFSIVLGIFCGATAGFLFGWMNERFEKSKLVTNATKIETGTGETILFETGANHFKGAEAVGGKLYLTNKRLVFKSHKLNIQNHELSINLPGIDKVERYKAPGLANNGLAVTTSNNKIEKFVVQQPDEWFNKLTEKNGLSQLHVQ